MEHKHLRIDTYILIGDDTMPDILKEKQSFTILISEDMIKKALTDELLYEDFYNEEIKPLFVSKLNEIFKNSEYIKEARKNRTF